MVPKENMIYLSWRMIHRTKKGLLFVSIGVSIIVFIILVIGGKPTLPGYRGTVQQTNATFFLPRHLARLISWPAVQHKSNRTIDWTNPQISGDISSVETGELTLETSTYYLPVQGSDTAWSAKIINQHGFTLSGNMLIRDQTGYLMIAGDTLPNTAYPLHESTQQALHILADTLRLRRMELPQVVTDLFNTSPQALVSLINDHASKARIVADESGTWVYLFSGEQFVFSGISSPTSGMQRGGSWDKDMHTLSLAQDVKQPKASIMYQQYVPINATIAFTISRRERRSAITYMVAGTCRFPKGFTAAFTGTRTIERSALLPLEATPKNPIPRAQWESMTP